MKKLPSLLATLFLCSWCLIAIGQERFEFTHFQMGTQFKIKLYAQDSLSATKAALAAFARIDELNQTMSDYVVKSEINRLSRTAGKKKKVKVSDDLWQVLSYAQQVSKKTNGAFDVTIGQASRVWRKAFQEQVFPKLGKINAAKKSIGYENLKLDKRRQTATLTQPKTRLDLGGIAKGYALDEALKVLLQHNIKQALLIGGNDMIASEPPPNQVGWAIQIPNFQEDGSIRLDTAFLNNKALSIAGTLKGYLDWGGRRFYPIINPTTALGITTNNITMVMAPTCTETDALSSAFCVMDKQLSELDLSKFPNVYVIVQTPELRQTFSGK